MKTISRVKFSEIRTEREQLAERARKDLGYSVMAKTIYALGRQKIHQVVEEIAVTQGLNPDSPIGNRIALDMENKYYPWHSVVFSAVFMTIISTAMWTLAISRIDPEI